MSILGQKLNVSSLQRRVREQLELLRDKSYKLTCPGILQLMENDLISVNKKNVHANLPEHPRHKINKLKLRKKKNPRQYVFAKENEG